MSLRVFTIRSLGLIRLGFVGTWHLLKLCLKLVGLLAAGLLLTGTLSAFVLLLGICILAFVAIMLFMRR